MREDILQHHGVKGMKWGVRRSVQKVKTRVKEEVKSSKRERSWAKELKNINSMSSSKLKNTTNRIRLENDMKSIVKNQPIRTKADAKQLSADKKAYRNREKISDKDLKAKVDKMRLQQNLRKEVSRATKSHRDKVNNLLDSQAKSKEEWSSYANYGKSMVDYAYGKY